MKLFTAVSLAVLTAATGSAVMAQPQTQTDPAYQSQVDQYQSQQNTYQNQRDAYEGQRQDYAARRRAYERQLHAYEEARRDYDARYGVGAYERIYPAPVYQEEAYAPGPDRCDSRRAGGAVAGGLLGALAGSVIGSNVAGRGDRAGGAILGGVVGGAAGVAVGASAARCDDRGYYYAYDQTFPYREGPWEEGRPSGRYDYGWYQAHHCRLAVASGYWRDQDEDRYVRVCPDADGHYRFAE